MKTLVDVEISKLIVNHCFEIKKLIDCKEDLYYIDTIISKNKKIIDDFNLKNLTIIDLNKREIGRFNATVKKIAKAYFREKYNESTINKLVFDDFWVKAYVLTHRNIKNKCKPTQLELSSIEILKTEILNNLKTIKL